MSDSLMDSIWSKYTISPELGMSTLRDTCVALLNHPLSSSDLVPALAGVAFHPRLAEPLREVIPALKYLLYAAAQQEAATQPLFDRDHTDFRLTTILGVPRDQVEGAWGRLRQKVAGAMRGIEVNYMLKRASVAGTDGVGITGTHSLSTPSSLPPHPSRHTSPQSVAPHARARTLSANGSLASASSSHQTLAPQSPMHSILFSSSSRCPPTHSVHPAEKHASRREFPLRQASCAVEEFLDSGTTGRAETSAPLEARRQGRLGSRTLYTSRLDGLGSELAGARDDGAVTLELNANTGTGHIDKVVSEIRKPSAERLTEVSIRRPVFCKRSHAMAELYHPDIDVCVACAPVALKLATLPRPTVIEVEVIDIRDNAPADSPTCEKSESSLPPIISPRARPRLPPGLSTIDASVSVADSKSPTMEVDRASSIRISTVRNGGLDAEDSEDVCFEKILVPPSQLLDGARGQNPVTSTPFEIDTTPLFDVSIAEVLNRAYSQPPLSSVGTAPSVAVIIEPEGLEKDGVKSASRPEDVRTKGGRTFGKFTGVGEHSGVTNRGTGDACAAVDLSAEGSDRSDRDVYTSDGVDDPRVGSEGVANEAMATVALVSKKEQYLQDGYAHTSEECVDARTHSIPATGAESLATNDACPRSSAPGLTGAAKEQVVSRNGTELEAARTELRSAACPLVGVEDVKYGELKRKSFPQFLDALYAGPLSKTASTSGCPRDTLSSAPKSLVCDAKVVTTPSVPTADTPTRGYTNSEDKRQEDVHTESLTDDPISASADAGEVLLSALEAVACVALVPHCSPEVKDAQIARRNSSAMGSEDPHNVNVFVGEADSRVGSEGVAKEVVARMESVSEKGQDPQDEYVPISEESLNTPRLAIPATKKASDSRLFQPRGSTNIDVASAVHGESSAVEGVACAPRNLDLAAIARPPRPAAEVPLRETMKKTLLRSAQRLEDTRMRNSLTSEEHLYTPNLAIRARSLAHAKTTVEAARDPHSNSLTAELEGLKESLNQFSKGSRENNAPRTSSCLARELGSIRSKTCALEIGWLKETLDQFSTGSRGYDALTFMMTANAASAIPRSILKSVAHARASAAQFSVFPAAFASRIFALVSAIIRTPSVTYHGAQSLVGESTPHREWEREGIGTGLSNFEVAGAGARERI
ncbi:hypothetical protein B0H11DRAFT_2242813 [Mycena galericulata]|nr:hypothetical protein B0H11DRAFT_2242813 [Mycena galericulata]